MTERYGPVRVENTENTMFPVKMATRLCAFFVLAIMAAACTGNFWLTPDQQAARAMEKGEYVRAAELFSDPFRKGTALFRAGEFEAAANAFGMADTAPSNFNRGNSFVMLGRYDEAVAAYDRALDKKPGWREAVENREIALLRGDILEKEGGDMTGGMLGADEIVFDDGAKDKSGGRETVEADSGARLTDEQLRSLWLRRVQTKPADFLRAKFAYQLADQNQ